MQTHPYDLLIVGAGLFGATVARLAVDAGLKVLVVEKRNHIGGNCYTEKDGDIVVHKYGAHIFHTSDHSVWSFVNKYADFNRFTNSPLAFAPDSKLYNLPFNMNTFSQIWGITTPQEAQKIIHDQRLSAKKDLEALGLDEPKNLEQQALMLVGKDVYELLIKEYTEKQWGRPCSQLPPEIIRRLPIRWVFDNNYFNDDYQGIPISGYTPMINRLLTGAETKLNVDFEVDRAELTKLAPKIVYTGPIDAFYNYKLGHLAWRTVNFKNEKINVPNFQGNAVINYTSKSVPFTRIIEHKHFEKFGAEVDKIPYTIISKEFPVEWEFGMEPYYPINDSDNNSLFEKYNTLAKVEPNVVFGGRLAQYRYFDMAPTIAEAFKTCHQNILAH